MRTLHSSNLLFTALLLVVAVSALAAVPSTINYQGYLKDSAGAPVNGPTSIRFSLYSSNPPRNDNYVWRETKSVTPSNGIYSSQLGSVTPITASFDVPYWLGVKVATDAEMPLQPLASVPYALRAAVAVSAQCTPGDILSCYTGPSRTMNVGACKAGTKTCGQDGVFGECTQVVPTEEICLNGIDDNCDGHIDEGCQLPNGSACTDASACASGYCSNGYCCSSQTGLCCTTDTNCSSLNQSAVCTPYTTCMPKKTVATCSASNVCQTALVDDPTACVGQICANSFCAGTSSIFWTPPSACNGSGVCTPTGSPVSCNDGNVCTDDFCNAVSGCSHTSNNTPTQSCYKDALGNPLGGTPGVGICTNGTQQCSNGSWGPCLGAVGASSEVCGTSPAQDENCNGLTNEQDAVGCTVYRFDNDSDGYGVTTSTRCYCTPGYASVGAAKDKFTAQNYGPEDCNDSTALAYPGQTEKCSLPYDENCNGTINEDNAEGCLLRYLDNDRDGYGTTASKCSCIVTAPYDSIYSNDCNDNNANINPGKPEICNGIDDNCTGTVDTAEVPIGTLCPTPANASGSTCVASPTMCRAVCATYWWDVDTSFANGCEVQEDGFDQSGLGDSCPGYYYGSLYENGYASPYYADFTGNILPSGDLDYYYVYASDSSGDGTVRLDVRFLSNTNSIFRYSVYNSTSCSTLLVSGQTAANLFTTPGYYVVRVNRNGGGASPSGETYQIRISNGLY
jgi:hypothetical protein